MEAVYIPGKIIELGVREAREYKLAILDTRKAY